MSERTAALAGVKPFEITHRPDDTNGDFVRFESIVHPAPEAAGTDHDLDHERYLIDNPDEHVHPHQREVIEVLVGEYGVAFEGTEHRLGEGEEIIIPEDTPHRHWNPTAQPVRVAHEHHPARDSGAHAAAMYALARDGKTDEKGLPNPLQFAVLNDAYPGVAYSTAIPIPVQKAMTALLAPIGRVVGYEASYALEK